MSNRKPFIRPGYARCVDCGCEVRDNPDAINACADCRDAWEAELASELRFERAGRRERRGDLRRNRLD